MSLLLAGPSSIKPWIEKTVFEALVGGHAAAAEPQRRRLGQVLAVRGFGPEATCTSACEDCPSILVLHDGETSVICCFKNKPRPQSSHLLSAGLPTKGCIVRISNFKVSLVERCCSCQGRHHHHHVRNNDAAVARPDAVSHYLEMDPLICLDVTSVETLGGHGMGIVGNPLLVHRSVPVRRALLSLYTKKRSLAEQLNLVTPLGNVQQLFASSVDVGRPLPVIQSLIALAKKDNDEKKQKKKDRQKSPVRLGNVRDLLLASSERAKDHEDSPFGRLVALAKQPLPDKHAPKKNNVARVVLGDVRALLSGNNANGVTVNQVLQCARPMDSTFSVAQNGRAIMMEEEEQEEEPPSEIRASEATAALQAEIPSTMEPYDMRENVDRHDSIVSVSGMQSDLMASLLISEADTRETEVARPPLANVPTTGDATNDEDDSDSSDKDSNIAGISDMLISQTQDEDASEQNPCKERSLGAENEGSSGMDDAAAAAPPQTRTKPTAEGRPRSLLQHVTSQAQKGGMGDVLNSQTKDEGASEQSPRNKRSLGAANEGSPVEDDDARPQKRTKPNTKSRPRSLLQHVMGQARKGSRTSDASPKPGPVTSKRSGMLSSWLAQRVRPKGR